MSAIGESCRNVPEPGLRPHLHRYHPPWRRAVYSAALIATVVGVGTLGMHRFEGLSYLDAFYFMSMVATAQGPAFTPVTPAGKLFAAFMAYLSIGTVVAALGFLFGPFFGVLWKTGVEHVEQTLRGRDGRR